MKNRMPIHGGSPASGYGSVDTTITSGNRLFVNRNRNTGDEPALVSFPPVSSLAAR